MFERARCILIFFVLFASLRVFVVPAAQGRGGGNWNAVGADAQRTGWLKTETRISTEALAKPGAFQLLWKVKPENQARQLQTLTQPLILGNLISHKGFKALAFFGGSGDIVYAYDYDLGKVYWSHKLSTAPAGASTPACPAALTAVARSAPLNPNAPLGGRGRGGQPPVGVNPANLPITNAVWAISSDGMVHALNPHIGDDLRTPVRIVPSGANVVGSILVNDVLYAATSGACNGARNGVSSLDVSTAAGTTAAAKQWDSGDVSIAGGPVMGLNELVYVATGAGSGQYANAIVALDSKTLEVRDWFAGTAPFTSAPVAFAQGTRNLVAAASADGRLYVFDGASPGGADHRTPLARSAVYTSAADFAPGGVTTWEADGTRWLLVAAAAPLAGDAHFATTNGAITNGTVAAFTLAGDGAAALAPAWTSRDLVSPSTPIVLNDAVFVVSTGAFRTADAQMSAADRLQRSRPAVLYALDAKTGKELWTSGRAIAASVQGVAPSGQDGQVYVVAADGMLYAFGIPLEH